MVKKILLTASVVIIIAIVAVYFVYNKPHRSTGVAEVAVTAQSLVSTYNENESEANTKFLDKVVEVKGKVKEVIEQDDSFILLLGDESSMSSVSCTLDHESDSVAYGLKPGDEVVVRGICTGFLMDVVIVNCKVVSDVPEM